MHTKKQKTQENSRFSSLFAAGDVSRETSSAAKSEEKRLFSQVNIMMTDFSCFWVVISANSGSLGPVNGDLLYSFLLYVLHAFTLEFMHQSVPKVPSPTPPREPGGTTEVGSEFRGPGGTSPPRIPRSTPPGVSEGDRFILKYILE